MISYVVLISAKEVSKTYWNIVRTVKSTRSVCTLIYSLVIITYYALTLTLDRIELEIKIIQLRVATTILETTLK